MKKSFLLVRLCGVGALALTFVAPARSRFSEMPSGGDPADLAGSGAQSLNCDD